MEFYNKPTNEELSFGGFWKIINLVFLSIHILDMAFITIYSELEGHGGESFLLVFALPSLMIHIFPAVKREAVFRWIAHTISVISLGLVVVSVVLLFMVHPNSKERTIIIGVIFLLTGPSALVSASLLAVLHSIPEEPESPKVVYLQVYAPVGHKSMIYGYEPSSTANLLV